MDWFTKAFLVSAVLFFTALGFGKYFSTAERQACFKAAGPNAAAIAECKK